MLFQSTASIGADCSLVQGQDLEALRVATPYQHIVYCGDGANDLCPALALGPTDVVLARKVQSPNQLAVNSLHVSQCSEGSDYHSYSAYTQLSDWPAFVFAGACT